MLFGTLVIPILLIGLSTFYFHRRTDYHLSDYKNIITHYRLVVEPCSIKWNLGCGLPISKD